jgi:haloalkane dehalogenase
MVEVLRTPDERFAGLLDWSFEPHYREVLTDEGTSLRFHFVDEGPREAMPVVLLHGNPTWSYLHRHMINGLVALGHRVLALDLMGMGRSDKPVDPAFFTMARHVDWVGQWLVAEEIEHATLYCQDWGGSIGLVVLAEHGDRFDRVIASNTGLPVGEGENEFLRDWIAFSQSVDELPIATLVASGTTRSLSEPELAAYSAPFPDGRYQAAAKQFPVLIPVQPDNPGVPQARAAWDSLETFTKPFLTVFGSEDPVAFKPGSHLAFQRRIPGAAGRDHIVLNGPNHFIQEDAPDELVEIIDRFITATPS